MIGKLFGNRYEIIAKLGAGGMANVYKARCTILVCMGCTIITASPQIDENDFI